MRKLILLLTLISAFATSGAYAATPAAKTFEVCWSHYTGWEPWAYADEKAC